MATSCSQQCAFALGVSVHTSVDTQKKLIDHRQNSAVQNTLATHFHDIAVVSTEFLHGGAWHNPKTSASILNHVYGTTMGEHLDRLQHLAANGQIHNSTRWFNMTAEECIERYDTRPRVGLGSILAVTDQPKKQNDTVLAYEEGDPSGGDFWVFNSHIQTAGNDLVVESLPGRPRLAYCLALKVPGRCSVQVHVWFLAAVSFCNALKVACMVFALREKREPLATVGDAIESFLRTPESSSKGICLYSEAEVKDLLKARKNGNLECVNAKKWNGNRLRYYEAVKSHRWLIYTSA